MTVSRTLPRHRARKVFVAAVAAASAVAAVGSVVVSASAYPRGKVSVCKYVGTPGVDERLQTGQNPIEVTINASPDSMVSVPTSPTRRAVRTCWARYRWSPSPRLRTAPTATP